MEQDDLVPESTLDAIEEAQHEQLTAQRDRSEREFREGKVVSWHELKRECGL